MALLHCLNEEQVIFWGVLDKKHYSSSRLICRMIIALCQLCHEWLQYSLHESPGYTSKKWWPKPQVKKGNYISNSGPTSDHEHHAITLINIPPFWIGCEYQCSISEGKSRPDAWLYNALLSIHMYIYILPCWRSFASFLTQEVIRLAEE